MLASVSGLSLAQQNETWTKWEKKSKERKRERGDWTSLRLATSSAVTSSYASASHGQNDLSIQRLP